jgi:hypothetical protein
MTTSTARIFLPDGTYGGDFPGTVPLFEASVSPLTVEVGGVVTLTVNGPVVSREWRRNGVAISGATGTTYTTVEADEDTSLTCYVVPLGAQEPVEAGPVSVTESAAPPDTWTLEETFDSLAAGVAVTTLSGFASVRVTAAGSLDGNGTGGLRIGGPNGFALQMVRHTTALGIDAESEVTVADVPGVTNRTDAFAMVRSESGNDNHYSVRWSKTPSAETLTVRKRRSASESQIGDAVNVVLADNDKVSVRAVDDGSNCIITVYVNGTALFSRTDTTDILTGTFTGLGMYRDANSIALNGITVTNWRARSF